MSHALVQENSGYIKILFVVLVLLGGLFGFVSKVEAGHAIRVSTGSAFQSAVGSQIIYSQVIFDEVQNPEISQSACSQSCPAIGVYGIMYSEKTGSSCSGFINADDLLYQYSFGTNYAPRSYGQYTSAPFQTGKTYCLYAYATYNSGHPVYNTPGAYGAAVEVYMAPIPPSPIEITTIAPNNLGFNGATLIGDYYNNTGSTAVRFKWAPGTCTSEPTTYQIGDQPVSSQWGRYTANLTGLSSGNTYCYRALKQDGTGYVGNPVAFTTHSPLSLVTYNAVPTDVTATLSGQVYQGSQPPYALRYSLYANTCTGNPIKTFDFSHSNPGQSDTVARTEVGLTPNTPYCYRLQSQDGNTLGGNKTFTTSPPPFTVATNPATNITSTSATLNGQVTLGSSQVRFRWGNRNGSSCVAGDLDTTASVSGTQTGTFSANISGLTADIVYCFRAEKSDGSSVAPTIETFRAFTIQTSFAVVSSENSLAELYGKVIGTTSTETTNVRFKYGPRTGANCVVGDLTTYTSSYAQTGAGQFSTEAQNLIGDRNYCFRAEKSDGSMLGAIKAFYISSPLVLTTGVAYEYSPGSVYMTGTATQDVGSHFIFTYGLKMGSVCSPSDLTSYINAYSTGNGEYRSNNVIGLASGEYCFRAETAMGDVANNIEEFFSTQPAFSIQTGAGFFGSAISTETGTVILYGQVTSGTGTNSVRFKYGIRSGSTCTASVLTQPTTSLDFTGTGTFDRSVALSELTQNTTYCFRAEKTDGSVVASNILSFFMPVMLTLHTESATMYGAASSPVTLSGTASDYGYDPGYRFSYGVKNGSVCAVSDLDTYVDGYAAIPRVGQPSIQSYEWTPAPETTYCFRVESADDLYVADNIEEFSTSPAFSLRTDPADLVGDTTATLRGTVTEATGTHIVGFAWGPRAGASCHVNDLVNAPTIANSISKDGTGPYSKAYTGLSADTTYCFRAQDYSDFNPVTFGEMLSFTTSGVSLKTYTDGATQIPSTTTFRLDGHVDPNGQGLLTKDIKYGTDYTTVDNGGGTSVLNLTGGDAFYGTTTAVTPGITYWYMATVTDSVQTKSDGSPPKSFILSSNPLRMLIDWTVRDYNNPANNKFKATAESIGIPATEIYFEYQQPISSTWKKGESQTGFTTNGSFLEWVPGATYMAPGKSMRIRACGKDSTTPTPQTVCSSTWIDVMTIPSGTLTLSSMTSCYPPSPDQLTLKYLYTGSSSFTSCNLVINSATVVQTITPPPTGVGGIVFTTTGQPLSYEVRCQTDQGGQLSSNKITLAQCTSANNLLLTSTPSPNMPTNPSCMYTNASFHDGRANKIEWATQNGVEYTSCTALMDPPDVGGAPVFLGGVTTPPSDGNFVSDDNVKIQFDQNKDPSPSVDSARLTLRCVRSFDEGEEEAILTTKGICDPYPKPTLSFNPSPKSVSFSNPTTNIQFTLSNVSTCTLTTNPVSSLSGETYTGTGPNGTVSNKVGGDNVDLTRTTTFTFTCVGKYTDFTSVTLVGSVCLGSISTQNNQSVCNSDVDPRFQER